MPQIAQLTHDAWYLSSQIFWLVLTFGLVFLVVGRGMLPKVQANIAARDGRIQGDLTAAKAARDAADQAGTAWEARDQANREAAQALVAEARASATKASEATLGEANRVQADKVAAGEAAIRAAADKAMGEIEGVVAEAAQAIVARVSGAQVSADEARAAVQKVLHA